MKWKHIGQDSQCRGCYETFGNSELREHKNEEHVAHNPQCVDCNVTFGYIISLNALADPGPFFWGSVTLCRGGEK